jgi:hypothetical protein
MIIVLSFESLTVSGSLLRERAIIEVIAGFRMHWESTSLPMKPVHPVRTNFMILQTRGGSVLIEMFLESHRNGEDQDYHLERYACSLLTPLPPSLKWGYSIEQVSTRYTVYLGWQSTVITPESLVHNYRDRALVMV